MAKERDDDHGKGGPATAPPAREHKGGGAEKAGEPKAPPAPEGGPLPRVVGQDARAGKGESRYKVRAEWPDGQAGAAYVLAAAGDRDGAVECYLAFRGLAQKRDDYQAEALVAAQGDKKLARPKFRAVVTELPD